MRYTGPKNRLARRENADLGLKTVGSKAHASLLRKLAIPPGQHGSSKMRKTTEYGRQLREKQKVKRMYGLTEKAMRKAFTEAKRKVGNTADNLVIILESRFDNVIYRLGWAPTRPSARQLVNHYHFLVNGKKLNIPSASVKVGDEITLKRESTANLPVVVAQKERNLQLPDWLESKKYVGKVKSQPTLEELQVSWQSVIEFYSR